MRRWIARRLHFLADRLAPEDAYRSTGMTFEFVRNVGIEVNHEGHGCRLWYHGQDDYQKAFERGRG